MRTSTIIFACLVCLSTLACRPHPENGRGEEGREGHAGHGLRRACAADLEKFCVADQKGKDRRECLQSHIDQISADCKAALEKHGHKGRRDED